MELKILWASMYGNAEYVAQRVEKLAEEKNFEVEMIEMNDVTMDSLSKMENVAIVTSTTGQGDLPTNGEWFWDDLEKTDISLQNVRYSVCALGDSSHAEFCNAGRKVDKRFEELGAVKILERQECDGDDAGSHKWAVDFLEKLGARNG
tara:strand:+ start:125 stop:568 length:444 start_codon:yes stop_codon:yes gene_type:complete